MLPSLHSRELRAQLTRFSSKGSCPLRSFVGGVKGTKLDVAEGDSSVGLLGLDIAGLARGGGASTASSSDLVRSDGVSRVEPKHVGGVVIPDGEDESHTGIEVLTEGSKTALLGEFVGVTGNLLLFLAELVGDLVGLCDSGDVGVGLLDDLAVLNVDSADCSEGTGRGVVVLCISLAFHDTLLLDREGQTVKNCVTTVILDLESTVLPGPKKLGAPNL